MVSNLCEKLMCVSIFKSFKLKKLIWLYKLQIFVMLNLIFWAAYGNNCNDTSECCIAKDLVCRPYNIGSSPIKKCSCEGGTNVIWNEDTQSCTWATRKNSNNTIIMHTPLPLRACVSFNADGTTMRSSSSWLRRRWRWDAPWWSPSPPLRRSPARCVPS